MPTIALHHGDTIEVMKTLPSASVDMILCDPPYGTTECSWDTIIPLDQMWEQYCRIAKKDAAIVLTAAQPFTSILVSSNPKMFRYEWIWEKGNATGFLNAKKQPLRAHESVLVFYRSQPIYNPQMTHGHPRKTAKRKDVNSECYGKALKLQDYDSSVRFPRSVQFFSNDKQNGSFHPTQKPVLLNEYLIQTYTHPGHVVLDNTMGSGSTGVACVRQGRGFVGIDSDAGYVDVARSRIDAELAKPTQQRMFA